jgi:hypothetical protein
LLVPGRDQKIRKFNYMQDSEEILCALWIPSAISDKDKSSDRIILKNFVANPRFS